VTVRAEAGVAAGGTCRMLKNGSWMAEG